MIVFDNIIFSLQKMGGISVVWKNLLERMIRTEEYKCIEYPNSSTNLCRQELNISDGHIIHRRYFNPIVSQLCKPKITAKDKFIFHSSYFRLCSNPKAINITTVHDFISEYSSSPPIKQRIRNKINNYVIRHSDAIVCISKNTKRDLFKFIENIDGKKVYLIYNGVSEDYQALDSIPYPSYQDCVLFVGDRVASYKNFRLVVKSLSSLNYRLLICGKPLLQTEKEFLDATIPNKYMVSVFPSNIELNKIYNSAFCLAYPSSYEGFGIPVLEAQKSGCPVIALNASSIPEIIGDQSLLMSEPSINEFRNRVLSLGNMAFRNKMIVSGYLNAKKYSWDDMARQYKALYTMLLETHR